MNIFVLIPALFSLIMGILVLSYPKFLRLMVGWYFVILGILGILATIFT